MGLESLIESTSDLSLISLSSNNILSSRGVNGERERDLFCVVVLLVLSTGKSE